MKRDMQLIYLIFNVLIDTDDKSVTSRKKIDSALNSYSKETIDYHLALMSGQKWIEIFTDGIRMTWDGHDYYDTEFVDDDSEDVEEKKPVLFKQD